MKYLFFLCFVFAWNLSFGQDVINPIGIESDSVPGWGFRAIGNSSGGFNATRNGNNGFLSTRNSNNGYTAEINDRHGFYSTGNSDDGFHAFANDGDGVYSFNNDGDEGYFEGTVVVTGNLSKGGGSFKIDHPLDPENKYLYHSFVESPDMMNVYNGNALLNDHGEATVLLEEWFQALNKDFRYQLTAIGAPGPNLYISEEISNNTFKIAGGKPGTKVSWQVTGIRKDPYAVKNRIPVEEEKPAQFKGYYLHPEAYQREFEKSQQYVKLGYKTLKEIEAEQTLKSKSN